MVSQEEFTIAELEEATGQSRRSIHHYISRGLLPNPTGQGPAARYGREHYLRLRLIDYASSAGFKIDQKLQGALDRLGIEEMESLVLRAERSTQEDIRHFGQWLLTGDAQATVPQARSSRMSPGPGLREQAALFSEFRPEGPPMDELQMRLPSTAAFLKRSARMPAASSDAEQWERLRLGNDVEVSWRPRYDARFIERLRRLLQVANELFGDEEQRRRREDGDRDV